MLTTLLDKRASLENWWCWMLALRCWWKGRC